LSDISKDLEEILDEKNKTLLAEEPENSWRQKINEISLISLENKTFNEKPRISLSNEKTPEKTSFPSISEVKSRILMDIYRKHSILKKDLNKLCDVILLLQTEPNLLRKRWFLTKRDILLDKTAHKMNELKGLLSLIEDDAYENEGILDICEKIHSVDAYLGLLAKEKAFFNEKIKKNEPNNKRYSHLTDEKSRLY
jgi:hypothetical protein